MIVVLCFSCADLLYDEAVLSNSEGSVLLALSSLAHRDSV